MANNPKLSDLWWIQVQDKESARYALKMAGLPFFLIGLYALFYVATSPLEYSATQAPVFFIMPAILLIAAFRLRSGHAGWVPLATTAYILFFLLMFLGTFVVMNSERMLADKFITALGLLIPLFCLGLTLSGTRAWLWMKKNGEPTKY